MANNKVELLLLNELVKVQEKERQRISRDLHDSLSQEMSILKACLNTMSEGQLKPEVYNVTISRMKSILDAAISTVKEISQSLSPKVVEENKLSEAVEQLIGKFECLSEPKIEFFSSGIIGLSSKHAELHVYRTIQEFLNNSLRHAEAETIVIKLYHSESKVVVELSDDGKGFDPDSEELGMGLTNMEARMRLLGADYDYWSIPEVGTNLKITIDEKCC